MSPLLQNTRDGLRLSWKQGLETPEAIFCLGGRFDPEKNLAPPKKKFHIRRRHPPSPSAPPAPGNHPPPGFLNKNPIPPLPGASDPLPLPEQKKNKKYPKRPPSCCCLVSCAQRWLVLPSWAQPPWKQGLETPEAFFVVV